MIGRKAEKKQLNDAYASSQSEFVAVYGRRRIGKTFLITETFGNRFAFHHAGLKDGGMKRQLEHFRLSLRQQGHYDCPRLKDWLEAVRKMFGKNKTAHLTMITPEGLSQNSYKWDVQSEVTLDDLFKE